MPRRGSLLYNGTICRTCVLSFATLIASLAFGAPVWSASNYARTQTLSSDNLLRTVGVTYDFLDNDGAFNHVHLDETSALSDGTLHYMTYDANFQGISYSIGNNAKLEVVFPRAATVDALKFYSNPHGGRNGFNIVSVWVKRSADGDYEQLSEVSACSVSVSGVTDTETSPGDGAAILLTLTDEAGALAEGIYALRVNFGTMDNNGTNTDEIEVCGTLSEATSFHVVFLDQDGTTELKSVDLTPGESVTAPDIPAHEGWYFLGWDRDFSVVNTDLTIKSLWWKTATPRWTQDWWHENTKKITLATDNLLGVTGVTSEFKNNENRWMNTDTRFEAPSCLWNGTLNCNVSVADSSYIVGDNAAFDVTFPRATDVSELRLISWGGGGDRDGIHVKSVSVKRSADGEFEPLDVAAFSIGVKGVTDGEGAVEGSGGLEGKSKWAYRLVLNCPDGTPLGDDIFALRVNFGKMDNNGTFMEEIEVLGTISEAESFHIEFIDMDGTTVLKSVDIKPGESVTAPDIPTHEGYTFMGWDQDFSAINSDLTIKSTWAEAGKPIWTTGVWSDKSLPHSYTSFVQGWNLLSIPGINIVEVKNTSTTGEAVGHRDPFVVTNGVKNLAYYVVGNNSIIDFEFAEASSLKDIHLFSYWGNGGRDAFVITSVSVRTVGSSDFAKLEKLDSVTTDGFNNNNSPSRYYAYLATADGSMLATDVEAVRIEFGAVDNGYIGLTEVMMTGIPNSTIVPSPDLTLTGRARANAADVEPVPEGCVDLRQYVSGVTVEANYLTDAGMKFLTDTSVLTDGAYPFAGAYGNTFGVSDNAVLRFDFSRPVNIRNIDFYTWWSGGGRNGVGITDLYVRPYKKTAYRRLLIPEALSYDLSGKDGLVSVLSAGDEAFAESIDSIRIGFGTQENNGTGYQEISFIGTKAPIGGLRVIVR